MKHASLFSGIGGFDLAASWTGWNNLFHCEIDSFCRKILNYHFPNSISYGDIKSTDFTPWQGRIDVLSAGFPCQPFSQAGKRKGTDDDRYLWPETFRVVKEIRPRWFVGENVYGIVNWSEGVVFEQVYADLESENYSVQPYIIPACGVGAPHQRYRTWFVAHCDSNECSSGIKLDKPIWETTVTDGSTDVGYSYDNREDNVERGNDIDSADYIQNDRWTTTYSFTPDHRGVEFFNDEVGNAATPAPQDVADSHLYGCEWRLTNSGQVHHKSERTTVLGRAKGPCGQRTTPISEAKGRIHATDEMRNVDYANGKLQEYRYSEGEKGREKTYGLEPSGIPSHWESFPTQPPVCSRDDGFPNKLDGIAFSRWRTESIKAFGNAIVPQVAYRIFMAINAYEGQ